MDVNVLLNEMLEDAKKDKNKLRALSETAKANCNYKLFHALLDLEKELFPDNKESVIARKEARNFEVLFGMVGLTMNAKTAWLIINTSKLYMKYKTDFSLKDASELQAKANELFGENE